jgi:hypothetical protein
MTVQGTYHFSASHCRQWLFAVGELPDVSR